MATVLHSTRFTSPSTATTSFDVTIPATAAGSAIVIIAGGNATIQAKLGGSSGTSFTKRTSSLSTREVVAQDIVDSAGGTTTVNFGLNGAQNIDGMIYEFASGTLGSFVTGATEGGSSTDAQGQVATSSITTSGATILFMMFTSGDNNSAAGRRFWGMEPTGRQDANGYIQPDGGKLAYWSQIGISQQDTAGTFTAKSSHIAGGEQQSVVWAYTNMDTSTPAYTDPYANEISRENSKPGSLYSAWSGVTTNANIAGYTDSLSYAVGGTVNFKVDSGNVGFTIDIFRVGYYGYVLFGAKSQATVTGTPAVQPSPSIDSSGGTVCAWSTTATWSIPATATPGVY